MEAKGLNTCYSLIMNNHSTKVNNMDIFPKNTAAILELLTTTPAEKHNINQVAKTLTISVGSAHKIVKELEKDSIIVSERMGNALFYRLNLRSRESRRITELILMERRKRILSENPIARVYADALETCRAEAVILFGSLLTEQEKAKDVDVLFLVTDNTEVKKVNSFCLGLSKTKPVVPLIMTKQDMRDKLREKNRVITDIMKKGVVLSGEDAVVEVLSGAGN